MNKIIDDIEKITKVNLQEQTFLLKYLGRLTIKSRLKVMEQHRRVLFLFKDKYNKFSLELLSYASLVLTLKLTFDNRKKLDSLNFQNMSIEKIEQISLKKIELYLDKEFTRNKPKRERILRHWAEIKVLKTKGASFQRISEYLAKKRYVTCAKSTLHRLWHELEDNSEEMTNG